MKENIMKKLTAIAAVVLLSAACNSGMDGGRETAANGKTERLDRSQRTVIDGARYTDFTVRENNAAKFTKQDIMYDLTTHTV